MNSRQGRAIARLCKYMEHATHGHDKYYKIVDDLLLYVHDNYRDDEELPSIDPQAEYHQYEFTPRIGNLVLHILYNYRQDSEYRRTMKSIVNRGEDDLIPCSEMEDRVYDVVAELARMLKSNNPKNHIQYYAFIADLYWMFHYDGKEEEARSVLLFAKMGIHKYRRYFIPASALDAYAKSHLERTLFAVVVTEEDPSSGSSTTTSYICRRL